MHHWMHTKAKWESLGFFSHIFYSIMFILSYIIWIIYSYYISKRKKGIRHLACRLSWRESSTRLLTLYTRNRFIWLLCNFCISILISDMSIRLSRNKDSSKRIKINQDYYGKRSFFTISIFDYIHPLCQLLGHGVYRSAGYRYLCALLRSF